MLKRTVFLISAFFLLQLCPAFGADLYTIDPAHSTVGFKVRHLGVSYVTGKFDKFEGTITFDGNNITALEGKVDATTVDTAEPKRDGHLKSPDFFAAEKFPSMEFKSTKITQNGDKIAIVGNLIIRDVTKVVEFQGEFGGFAVMGQTKKAGLVLTGEINRKDFGLQFNKLIDSGQAMVGDQVKINLELEANNVNP